MGRPKSELVNDVETIKRKAHMLRRGLDLVDDEWDDIIRAMIDVAKKKKSVMAATWLRDTFIGKPREQVELSNEGGKVFELAYKIKDAIDEKK